jgi:hypothetical protein
VIVVPVEAIGRDASRAELLILLDQLVASRCPRTGENDEGARPREGDAEPPDYR